MKIKNKTILAIDPGLRDLGYAVFQGGTLVIAGVKPFSALKPSQRLSGVRAWVRYMLNTLKPATLLLERTNGQRKGVFGRLHRLVASLSALARRSGISVESFPAQTVRKNLTGSGWASKTTLAQAVASRIPVLRIFLTQDRRWKERYFQNMFDATALALHHQSLQ